MLKHDYVAMPVGATIEQGVIQVCPYCNRPGIKETVQGKDFYTHSQWSGFDSNGQFSLGWDMCPKSFARETVK